MATTYEEWFRLPEAEGIRVDRKTVQVRVRNFGLVIRRDPLTTRLPHIAVFLRSNVVEQDG